MVSNQEGSKEAEKSEILYKTKTVDFFGRSVPIILQNDNGPCPLLAICNVLLLRNNISLGVDVQEVASSRLLSLVAERIIDSNSNIEGKNEEYARNQQQNISDALSLLPQLATGLDVNVRFCNIHDFEFTPNCAVFDLLDIGLVHGWLCDPQDKATSKILAPHSYNTLVERLVKLQALKADLQTAASVDSVDFAAATTATLAVPSPSCALLLKTSSFENQDSAEDLDCSEERSGVAENLEVQRKGDVEENTQLLEALKLSEVEIVQRSEEEPKPTRSSEDSTGPLGGINDHALISAYENSTIRVNIKDDWFLVPPDVHSKNSRNVSRLSGSVECNQQESEGRQDTGDSVESVKDNESPKGQMDFKDAASHSVLPVFNDGGLITLSTGEHSEALELEARTCSPCSASDISKGEDFTEQEMMDQQHLHDAEQELDHQSLGTLRIPLGCRVDLGAPSSSYLPSSEPLFKGEAEVSAGACVVETREPLYEGESNLPESAHQISIEEEGSIISSFLKNSATQLTYYGLFCLLEGLNERELCVFFRNNHFSTIYRFEGNLYLLVTDQGYLNQPDIVWEKLEEVHGDTVFVTGNFTPFQAAGESSGFWDEQGAIAATADYLSSHQQSSTSSGTTQLGVNNSDLELALSLQHQEFELQQQQQQPRQQPRPVSLKQSQAMDSSMRADSTRLITGPKRSSYTSKPEAKPKCAIM